MEDRALDLIICNGTVVTDTGKKALDIGILDGKIAGIGKFAGEKARRVIDCNGFTVAPGFIDMMGQTATPMLDDAASKPKILEVQPAIAPAEVLDAIDRALAAGQLWVFPGKQTSLLWRMRRWLPGLLWKNSHRIEGF